MFDELVKEIVRELEAKESRGRARGGDTKARFEYAVGFLIGELWRNSLSYPRVKARSILEVDTIPNYQDIGMRT